MASSRVTGLQRDCGAALPVQAKSNALLQQCKHAEMKRNKSHQGGEMGELQRRTIPESSAPLSQPLEWKQGNGDMFLQLTFNYLRPCHLKKREREETAVFEEWVLTAA